MNIFEELQPHIEAFKATREHLMSTASLPPSDSAISFGKPPFAIDDGINYYAVIDEKGNVSPLPFGYQIPNEDMEDDGIDAVFSKPVSSVRSGFNVARYLPLVEDYEAPGERAFCLETVEDSDAWEAVGQVVDALQQAIYEKAIFNFNQRLSNALVSLYEGCDQLETVDQAISALFMQPSVLSLFLLRSYQHALDKLEDEMNNEEED